MPDLIERAVAWVKSPAYIDFTTRQLAILGVVLAEPKPVRVRELASMLNLSRPVISRAVAALEEHSLVERHRGEDRRDRFVAPTETGQEFRRQVRATQ